MNTGLCVAWTFQEVKKRKDRSLRKRKELSQGLGTRHGGQRLTMEGGPCPGLGPYSSRQEAEGLTAAPFSGEAGVCISVAPQLQGIEGWGGNARRWVGAQVGSHSTINAYLILTTEQ